MIPKHATTSSVRFSGALLLVLAALTCALSACGKTYSQDSPDAVIASAKQMVKDKHARQLTGLIYADTPQMRELLNETGEALAALQRLAESVQKKYPDEIKALAVDVQNAASKGEATSLLQRLSSVAGSPRRRPRSDSSSGPPSDDRQEEMSRLFRDLFANPYAFLEDQEGKLTTKQITDDTAAVLWDSKPLFGVGLTMRRENDRWFIVLPTSMPPLNRVMPKTDEGWQILGELMIVATNMLNDLDDDVRTGKAPRLDDLARRAGDKAFLPAAMVMIAYGKVMEEERKASATSPPPNAPAPAESQPKPAVTNSGG